ncbi:MAG: hypothetical protein F6K11_08080 [Leptolyngbya sp. SIO3F4]|nr:hypothetical protein [Leptolyngbya sp. SIO3F4]
MATLILKTVKLLPSPNCPPSVTAQFKFKAANVGSPITIPKNQTVTFPANTSLGGWNSADALEFFMSNMFIAEGNTTISPVTQQDEDYVIACGCGAFLFKYDVTV